MSFIIGFTEGKCSELYHKAIRENPTITLRVAKAMTIGPPQVGKTTLHHHLLGLEPPLDGSTSVATTAKTVSVCPPGSAASPGEVGHVPPSGADLSVERCTNLDGQKGERKCNKLDSRMCMVENHKWVVVNKDRGILSLLTHLRDTIAARSRTRPKLVQDNTAAKDKIPSSTHKAATESIQTSTHKTAAEDIIVPEKHKAAAEKIVVPSRHEGVHREAAISRPSGDKSNAVMDMIKRIHKALQNPDIDGVNLLDANLLQFIDCGGQLAYQDILPLFVNIPAIYLNVFNVTEELTKCPTDELCSTEGNKMYAAKSALSVAEMVRRSAMTVCSLADRKVPLLPGVMCESKPRLMLVGTHRDKLDEKDADEKLRASDEILQKALQVKDYHLETTIMSNDKSNLRFFPISNKLYVDKRHQSCENSECEHCPAIQNLKETITQHAVSNAVEVKVPVRWYLHQLLEMSQSEKPFYSYSELYDCCEAEGLVTDEHDFHAMVTYFHALGLLIHLCGADVGHTEESACLVFTDPSHLFENISKLYLVQFEEVRGGEKVLLKHKGKLTKGALQELGVQLNPDHFMDLLVQLFIGAEIKSQKGGRILFVPSVLTSSPDDAAPSGVSTGPQEESLGFAVTFENTSFIPCGVFTGMSARLQNAEEWEICTDSISRKRMKFGVGTLGFVSLHDHATHISVKMEDMDCTQDEYQQNRDIVINAVADSYCFLFHSKSAKDPQSGPCSECVRSPYLVLGQTCQECRAPCGTPEATHHTPHKTCEVSHIAELKVKNQVAASVRCQQNQAAKKLSISECDLFKNMSHYVS